MKQIEKNVLNPGTQLLDIWEACKKGLISEGMAWGLESKLLILWGTNE